MLPAMDRLALFAVPVFAVDLPGRDDADHELVARLLAERDAGPGLQRSNVGGWHSPPDLAQRAAPCYRSLMQAIVETLRAALADLAVAAGQDVPAYRYGLHAWAMVMGAGDYAILHEHGDAHWSAVYYADAGDADLTRYPQSGTLALVDPRSGGRPVPGLALFPSTFTIRPRTGTLLLFPGWLPHYVHAYRGTRPRVAISCNLTLDRPTR